MTACGSNVVANSFLYWLAMTAQLPARGIRAAMTAQPSARVTRMAMTAMLTASEKHVAMTAV